ncbi:transposase [Streptomyces mauvecolor]
MPSYGIPQRTYTPEFREGAARIVIETGRPIPEVAEELGIHSGTLHSWVSRWRRNGSTSSDRPAPDETGGSRLRETERADQEDPDLRRAVGAPGLGEDLLDRVGQLAVVYTTKRDRESECEAISS